MVAQGPVAGAAAHGHAGEHQRAALLGRRADAASGDLRSGGHDHLEGVLHRLGGIEEEDVLGAGAHIYGKDAHGKSMIAPGSGVREAALASAFYVALVRGGLSLVSFLFLLTFVKLSGRP